MIRLSGSVASVNTIAIRVGFSGNDKRTEVLPKALDFGFGAFLLVRLLCYFRHATGQSICFTGMRSAESVARTSSRIKAVVALITMPQRPFIAVSTTQITRIYWPIR